MVGYLNHGQTSNFRNCTEFGKLRWEITVNGTFGIWLCCWKLFRFQNHKGNGNTAPVCNDQKSLLYNCKPQISQSDE